MPNVAEHRPEYDEFFPEWKLMRDSVRGEAAMKAADTEYLPMPSGFEQQSDKGLSLYKTSYQFRAQYPEIVNPAVQAMIGVIHSKEIQIDLPDVMMGLWENATPDGLPLEAFFRRITGELLTTGRYGLLVGAASTGSTLPYLVGYETEKIINWDDDRSFFVLDESGLVRNGFAWEEQEQYRVLELRNNVYTTRTYSQGEIADEAPAEDATDASDEEEIVVPNARGGRELDEIPFVVIGPRDLSLAPETPPLKSIANSALAMYQLSADYRWQLFMTGQETLFIINGDKPSFVGAGAVVVLSASRGEDGDEYVMPDAKYVGPSGTGIKAHREAMQDEANKAASAGARLFNSEGARQVESGDARRIRLAAETASLLSIAQASCAGLEKALRYIGKMMRLPDATIETIVVHAPTELVDREMSPEEMKAILGLYEGGLISYETAYENLQKGNVASPERDAEEERKLIDDDEARREPDVDPLLAGITLPGQQQQLPPQNRNAA